MSYRVTETIHHGDFYNVQTSHGPSVYLALTEALRASPYNGRNTIEDNRYTRECYHDLLRTGEGCFGWARYTVARRPTH